MKVRYFDRIHTKGVVEIEVNAKVAHFIKNEREKHKKLTDEEIENLPKKKKEEYLQREFERNICSLDELFENGYQPTNIITMNYEQEELEEEQELEFKKEDNLSDEFKEQECGCLNHIEKEIEQRIREEKYLNSPDYKKFLNSLKNEIRKTMEIMPEMVRKAMYLRFFEELSINRIAIALGIAKGTAQDYLSQGTKYLKYFLDKDIKKQDKLERERRMKIEQEKIKRRKKIF